MSGSDADGISGWDKSRVGILPAFSHSLQFHLGEAAISNPAIHIIRLWLV